MADQEEWEGEHENEGDEKNEIDESRKAKEKKHDAGAYDLEKVTDYAEEKEISASDISGVMGQIDHEVAVSLARERELLKVKISKDDVELIVRELEISKEKAETALREHGGDLISTLEDLTN